MRAAFVPESCSLAALFAVRWAWRGSRTRGPCSAVPSDPAPRWACWASGRAGLQLAAGVGFVSTGSRGYSVWGWSLSFGSTRGRCQEPSRLIQKVGGQNALQGLTPPCIPSASGGLWDPGREPVTAARAEGAWPQFPPSPRGWEEEPGDQRAEGAASQPS